MPTFQAERPGQLLDILKRGFPDWKTSTLKQRLKHRLILVDGRPAQSGAERVEAGSAVEILAAPPNPASLFPAGLGESPLPILYADDILIAVDKPSGLLSVASEREKNLTAVRIMREWLQGLDNKDRGEVHAAHRLDREASGVLLLTRSLAVKRSLAAAWHNFEKIYLAVADGIPEDPEGTVDLPLWEDKGLFVRVAESGKGERAVTHYRLLKTGGGRSLLEVKLETGRKHQIRVHMAAIGCPLAGDLRYGVSKAPQLALHAARLRITHPESGKLLEIASPVPQTLTKMLRKKPSSSFPDKSLSE